MLKNYFKIAFRNLASHRGYSFINITGLALGIACCLLIFTYVKDEVTFDRYHSNSGELYRIFSELDFGGSTMLMGATSEIEAAEFAERIPEITSFTRFSRAQIVVEKGEDFINEFGTVFSDPSVFNMFDFKVLSGALNDALTELNSVVITEDNAIKYFDKVDVAGEELTIRLEGKLEKFVIDAVVANLPSNSSLDIRFVLPWKKHEALQGTVTKSWGSIRSTSILQLKPGTNPLVVEQKMKGVRELLNPGEEVEFERNIISVLQPITDIHLSTEIKNAAPGIKGASDPTFSYILSAIALVILILACINFANLTVARSLPRAKEIGVRKVLGAHKEQLAFQFLSEALCFSLLSFVIGLIMAEFFLPVFGELVNKEFTSSIFGDLTLIASCFFLIVFTALLAGAYPAFVISRFSAVASLSGKVRLSGKRYVSKGLVLIQFTIAGILVIGTIVMNRQINHLLTIDLGYNDENLLIVDLGGNGENGQLLKNALSANPQINKMALFDGYAAQVVFNKDGKELTALSTSGEAHYMDLIEVPLLAGRMVKDRGDNYIIGDDTLRNVVVNESFLKEIGSDLNSALGITFESEGGEDKHRIVGVFPDYKYVSARRRRVSPVVFSSLEDYSRLRELSIKFNPVYLTEIQTVIESEWRKISPYKPLRLGFVSELNQNAFAEEKRWEKIISYSTFIAISISCLGLLGLAYLAAHQRQKEIGVRKVLGASVQQLVFLLNSSFSKLVLLSFILTVPIAYYLVNNWLDNFIDKIELGVVLFLVPVTITFCIAILTVSIQSFKIANSNPVNSLRNE